LSFWLLSTFLCQILYLCEIKPFLYSISYFSDGVCSFLAVIQSKEKIYWKIQFENLEDVGGSNIILKALRASLLERRN